jgi:hypothetical protein
VGDGLPFLTEMAAKGKPVPILMEKPDIPHHYAVMLRVYNDLIHDGTINFRDYVAWCETYGIRVPSIQFEYVWDVLNEAMSRFASWKKQRDKSSQKNSAKTTD